MLPMDIDFFAMVEQKLDNFGARITAIEEALTKLSNVEMEPDPSRVPGVRVTGEAPAPSRGDVNG
jgi:hypothetical protein